MNKVSIIVPIYNSELTLEKCINSILLQSYRNIELILIDDGSTDKSYEICNKYKHKDNRVILIKKENDGVSSTRNRGLDIAKGEYIMFCDSDDWVEETWVEELLTHTIQHKCSISICGFKWIDDVSNVVKNKIYDNKCKNQIIESNKIFELRKSDILNILWNKIFNTDIIKKNKIRFDEKLSLGEDLIFILKYIQVCDTNIGIINKPLYSYNYKIGNNLASRYNKDLFNIYKRLFSELYKTAMLVNINFDKYSCQYYSEYFAALLRCLNNTISNNNPEKFIEKIKRNNQIIRSEEFRLCISKANLQPYNSIYISILNTKQYYLFYLFCKVYDIKIKLMKGKHENNE